MSFATILWYVKYLLPNGFYHSSVTAVSTPFWIFRKTSVQSSIKTVMTFDPKKIIIIVIEIYLVNLLMNWKSFTRSSVAICLSGEQLKEIDNLVQRNTFFSIV